MRADAPPLEVLSSSGWSFSTRVDLIPPLGDGVAGVPVIAGRFVTRDGQDVPDQLDGLTLPYMWGGRVLDPAAEGSPIGCGGHTLRAYTRVESIDGSTSWDMPIGVFLLTRASSAGGVVKVEGAGLLERVREHQALAPGGLPTQSPIRHQITRLLREDGIEATFGGGLTDRVLPAGFAWGTDRVKTLRELIDAWPARLLMDGSGVARILPPVAPALAVVRWHDGEGGTLVSAPRELAREGVFNHVIVKVNLTGDDGQRSQDVFVEHALTRGPFAVGRYGWVSERFESDAVTTIAQAQSIAVARAEQSSRRMDTLSVEAAPDWRVEVGDTAHVTTRDRVAVGIVSGVDLPATPSDGPAKYTVEVDPR